MNRLIQGRLLQFAAGFLALQTLLITLSPAVRERTLAVEYPWTQWVALILWGLFTIRAHRFIIYRLPDADPYLFPAAAFLSGWGLLTVWRLDSDFGERQVLWLGISLLVLTYGLQLPANLGFLRRYKYILLTSGLVLTGLTLLFGTNPVGFGPRLWLGCCGIYFQPSEPLKLILVAYLAAYFADKLPIHLRAFPLIYPTLFLSGLAILLLLVQRDLGTASIFIALYTTVVYLATSRRRAILISTFLLIIVGFAGYYFVDIIQARIDSWLNPWEDPSGGSYQIIQSLLAVANGGLEGRGPGLGSPALVPVAISDFIFAAIAEETGLIGTVGLIAIVGLILARGLRTAVRAPDGFRRLLAAGITAHFGIQTLLIIGGNLRLLPLTGVTLPFVSYGGSSLLTSFVGLLLLLHISNHLDEEPAPLPKAQPYLALGSVLFLGLFAVALTNGWWAVVRGPDLLTRTDNPRRAIEDRYVPRGRLLDRSNAVLNTTKGSIGTFTRAYEYPDLAPVLGYNHPIYGQAGMEASLDELLRGLSGNPASALWWNHLLYGMSPAGLDVRLSIDLSLQYPIDEMLRGHTGAAILMNAESGEILAISSHPTFDPNALDKIGAEISRDPAKPLINRGAQGLYPAGDLLEPFVRALFGSGELNEGQLGTLYESFGFQRAPELRMPVAAVLAADRLDNVHVTPLQAVLAAAALSNEGIMAAPRIATAVNTPNDGWIILPAPGMSFQAVTASQADEAVGDFIREGQNYWSHTATASEDNSVVTWFLAGTPPNWPAAPLVVVVLLEEDNPGRAREIGQELLLDAMFP